MRHLTDEEKKAVKRVVDQAGAAEVLLLVGGLMAHDHPDPLVGPHYRSRLARIARDWRGEKVPPAGGEGRDDGAALAKVRLRVNPDAETAVDDLPADLKAEYRP